MRKFKNGSWSRQVIAVLLTLLMFLSISMQNVYAAAKYENEGAYGFVLRLYEVALGRPADETGLDSWYDRLISGQTTGASVARDFIFSDEFKSHQHSDDEFIRILYKTFFDREPDETGYQAWMALLEAGSERLKVCKGFTDSDEFTLLCERYGIVRGTIELPQAQPQDLVEQFVRRLYTAVLSREADPVGLESWKNLLKTHKATGSDVVSGFVFSPECLNKNLSDEAYVRMLYRGLFDRDADAIGLRDWTACLKNGQTRWNVCAGFINSDEFTKLCERYHIERGTAVLERVIDPNKPMIALTFDDGPSAHTPIVLDTLEKYQQTATFFVVGRNASVYGDYIKRAYDLGCEIGNHTNSHPNLTKLSVSAIKRELSITDRYVYEQTGKYTTVMRPPGGGYNRTVCANVGTPIIMWSIDTLDWKTRDVQATVNCVLNNAKDGDIVLMHDLHKPTAQAAKILIPKLVERGYQLVTVSELAKYRGGMSNGKVYRHFYK